MLKESASPKRGVVLNFSLPNSKQQLTLARHCGSNQKWIQYCTELLWYILWNQNCVVIGSELKLAVKYTIPVYKHLLHFKYVRIIIVLTHFGIKTAVKVLLPHCY